MRTDFYLTRAWKWRRKRIIFSFIDSNKWNLWFLWNEYDNQVILKVSDWLWVLFEYFFSLSLSLFLISIQIKKNKNPKRDREMMIYFAGRNKKLPNAIEIGAYKLCLMDFIPIVNQSTAWSEKKIEPHNGAAMKWKWMYRSWQEKQIKKRRKTHGNNNKKKNKNRCVSWFDSFRTYFSSHLLSLRWCL